MNKKDMMLDTDYIDGYDGKFYTIPMEPIMREQLQKICRLTQMALRDNKYNLIIPHEWQTNTIANCFIESLIRYMTASMLKNGSVVEYINFNNLLKFQLSYKQNDDAEKEGNINITIRPGLNAKLLIDSNKEYDDEKDSEELIKKHLDEITKITCNELNQKHKIIIPHAWHANAITNCFIETLIRYLISSMQINGSSIESVNFNDTLEFHLSYKKNAEGILEGAITIRPGINAKLLVKSDTFTEEEDDDE